MIHQRRGIILKTYLHHRHKIAVLDTIQGHIECIPDTDRVCVGALIHYTAVAHGKYSLLQQVEQVAVPWVIAQADILFLHHVLELCYFSIAAATCEPLVFTLLCSLYDQSDWVLLYKKIFLAKLYLLLHMQPRISSALSSLLSTMLTESVDIIAHQIVDLSMEKELDKWLRIGMERHPYRDHFKTIYFYMRMMPL